MTSIFTSAYLKIKIKLSEVKLCQTYKIKIFFKKRAFLVQSYLSIPKMLLILDEGQLQMPKIVAESASPALFGFSAIAQPQIYTQLGNFGRIMSSVFAAP